MSKKRNKPPVKQNQKILAAQYRNEFFRKIKSTIDKVCGNHIFPLIPHKTLSNLYLSRSTPFKFEIANGSNVPKSVYNMAKVVLSYEFRYTKYFLENLKLETSITDYFTVIFTLQYFKSLLRENDFKDALVVKEALKVFAINEIDYSIIFDRLHTILLAHLTGINNLQEQLYWFQKRYETPKSFPNKFENTIEIHSLIPESIYVNVDGNIRPATRLGYTFPFSDPEWLSIKPSQLNITNSFADIPVNIYIQSHALNRLAERIDCFWIGIVHLNMYHSFKELKLFYDSNNEPLVEFRIYENKAGYFRVSFVEGIILIRTFLFVTNNGTPEGQMLENKTGLQKLDKKYLAIDKLSTFMNSDIDKNEEVQNILRESGCQCIIDLFNNLKPLLTKTDNGFQSSDILSYISHDDSENIEIN